MQERLSMECESSVIEYYHPDAVLVEAGKKGTYGREAIKKELIEFVNLSGDSTFEASEERYQMCDGYIIYSGLYENKTEKLGVVKGKFTQIWRKVDDKYLLLLDEWSE
ncbi:unnamed protein product [Strongylus vulgaris]|uniref:DUF4440 domain-containing protein n=1 Tax=Strongylus vulgaris TaxID=40348 RepID=A0A3P7IZZ3_STRVU|nr:unnamed protein product [Strongylus vulgaris]